MFTADRILAVDDDPMNLSVIEETLRGKFQLRTARDGVEALRIAPTFLPDVVLLDAVMPNMDGYEVCSRMKNDSYLRHAQVIMVSARNAIEDRLRGYQAGANDYVSKPFYEEELLAKISAALRTKALTGSVQCELSKLCFATCDVLELISHLRDKETGYHLDRIRDYSSVLASALRAGPLEDQIDDMFLDNILRASALHDIGKVAIPDAILCKPGPLTDEEYEQMKQHTIIGEQILQCIGQHQWEPNLFKMAAEIARWHHECFDGSGYPDQLRREQIPLSARIVKVADVFDALCSPRVYKSAYPLREVKEQIILGQGSEFDPVIVKAMLENFDAFVEIYQSSAVPEQ